MEKRPLSFDSLLSNLGGEIQEIQDYRKPNSTVKLSDCLLGGLAMFSLKDNSLLSYVTNYKSRASNLSSVYGIKACPSDGAMRKILDGVSPSDLIDLYRVPLKELKSHGVLDSYLYLGKYLTVSIDGVHHFSSKKVCCEKCLEAHHQDGTITYSHKCLAAALVHPDKGEVFVVGTEAIVKSDGASKNDSELNASKRLLPLVTKHLSAYPLLVLEDALYGNGPHIKELQSHGHSFIISAKEGSQKSLFRQFKSLRSKKKTRIVKKNRLERKRNGTREIICTYEYANDLYLNDSHLDISVNMVWYEERVAETGVLLKKFCFITDIKMNKQIVKEVVRAGRSRWKIENETFNTLKNQGYHFMHNFGHGHQDLSTVFCILMMLAFTIDQIAQASDKYFKRALRERGSKKSLWEKVRQYFDIVAVKDMETIYKIISKEIKLKVEIIV